jgi:hypothetical protein
VVSEAERFGIRLTLAWTNLWKDDGVPRFEQWWVGLPEAGQPALPAASPARPPGGGCRPCDRRGLSPGLVLCALRCGTSGINIRPRPDQDLRPPGPLNASERVATPYAWLTSAQCREQVRAKAEGGPQVTDLVCVCQSCFFSTHSALLQVCARCAVQAVHDCTGEQAQHDHGTAVPRRANHFQARSCSKGGGGAGPTRQLHRQPHPPPLSTLLRPTAGT